LAVVTNSLEKRSEKMTGCTGSYRRISRISWGGSLSRL